MPTDGDRVLTVLSRALRATAKRFEYCDPKVEHWMPVLAIEIERELKASGSERR
jgi:hypothetical protein